MADSIIDNAFNIIPIRDGARQIIQDNSGKEMAPREFYDDPSAIAFQLARKVLEREKPDKFELSNDFFASTFPIPSEMSEHLVNTLKELSAFANTNMSKYDETPLALGTSSNFVQPIVLNEDEYKFLNLFKHLLDKSLEAREYQNINYPVDKKDHRVEKYKYVDQNVLSILEDESNIQAMFLNIVRKLISSDRNDVIDKLDRENFQLSFEGEGFTIEEKIANHMDWMENSDVESLINKAFQINILNGHFIIVKCPVTSDDPAFIHIFYFKEKPDLNSFVEGNSTESLSMGVSSIYESDLCNLGVAPDPRRAQALNAYGSALRLIDEVFHREPKNITEPES